MMSKALSLLTILSLSAVPCLASAQVQSPLIPPASNQSSASPGSAGTAHARQPIPPAPAYGGAAPSIQPTQAEPYPISPAAQPAADEVPAHLKMHPWTTRTAIGPTTLTLLEAQAAGTQAGPVLPTLGATASRSWQRYLDSFKRPLPETFGETVQTQ